MTLTETTPCDVADAIAEALQQHPDLLAVVERHIVASSPVPDWMVARVFTSPDLAPLLAQFLCVGQA